MQDGKLAARVLEEAIAAGFNGVMIGTQPRGGSGNLDDPDLNPFWEKAAELEATVYMHPMFGCGDPRLADYDMINAVGRGVDTATAIARMLFAGHFARYAGMTMVLSHGGGALPFMQGRLQRNRALHADYGDPVKGLESCYYDTVLFDPRALRFLIECYGVEKIMMGSDYPFPIGDPAPCAVVENAKLSAGDSRAILGDTAVKLFRLEGCGHAH
jgi:aminocarboxymuconate-semialdehyde decarboxylase